MLRYSSASLCHRPPTGYSGAVSTFEVDPVRLAEPRAVGASAALKVGPLVRRLQRFHALSPHDIEVLEKLMQSENALAVGYPLFQEGLRCDHVCVLIEGIACRYRMLSGGRRQILGYILPGDICDVQFATVSTPDHSVSLLTKGLVVKIAIRKLIEMLASYPAIRRAVDNAALIEKAILRQWLVNIAQRSASQRLGHFLCEYLVRMEQIGCLDHRSAVPFGINQVALADTLGMSTVHVNRTLQSFRAANLIVLQKRHLHVLDRDQLVAMAAFKPAYLQISNDV